MAKREGYGRSVQSGKFSKMDRPKNTLDASMRTFVETNTCLTRYLTLNSLVKMENLNKQLEKLKRFILMLRMITCINLMPPKA